MGTAESAVGERHDVEGAGVGRTILPGARGECLEDIDSGVKLHLGCGFKRWDGWTNIDLAEGDISADLRSLPFDDDHADVAAAIHVLEHFNPWEVQPLLKEWKRILKPGGKLILELPCMDKILYYMTQCLQMRQPMDLQMTWLALWGDPRHHSVAMMHKWGYTKDQLRAEIVQAGFCNIEMQEPKYHVAQRDMRLVAFKPLTT